MGHGIERIIENEMEIDCFGYAGARAWHGLGQRVGERGDASVTLAYIERAARADWNVNTDEVTTRSGGQEIDGVQALLRDRDMRVLGFTTDRNAVIQHREGGALLNAVVTSGKATWALAERIAEHWMGAVANGGTTRACRETAGQSTE